jgi:UDP-N-acetylglucosamine transferase subunit ALG13
VILKKNVDSDPLLIVSCKLSEYSKLLEDHYQDLTHSLDMQQQMTSGNTHTQGVTKESALKDSILFHTAENMMVDLLHTFPEGIITYE